jgi:hypothetical protein
MMGDRLERGFKYADLEREFQRISGCRSFPASLAGHDIRKIIKK